MPEHEHEHASSAHEHADGHKDDCAVGHGGHDGCCDNSHDHGHGHAHAHDHAVESAADAADDIDQPLPPISWKIVSIIYACGSLISVIFAVLDLGLKVEQVKGFWLIFALFPFALAYAIYMWRGQRAAEQVELKFKKVD